MSIKKDQSQATFHVLITLGNLGLLCSTGQQLFPLDLILHILGNIGNSPSYDRTQSKDHMLQQNRNTPQERGKGKGNSRREKLSHNDIRLKPYTIPQTL